ncbi:hypothetical protein IF2G_03354 [Cordyceps javanica]|nr:hypothetical protein IF2G_03354 [Cordyceps javanica]
MNELRENHLNLIQIKGIFDQEHLVVTSRHLTGRVARGLSREADTLARVPNRSRVDVYVAPARRTCFADIIKVGRSRAAGSGVKECVLSCFRRAARAGVAAGFSVRRESSSRAAGDAVRESKSSSCREVARAGVTVKCGVTVEGTWICEVGRRREAAYAGVDTRIRVVAEVEKLACSVKWNRYGA